MAHVQKCTQVCVQQYNENHPTSHQHGHFPRKKYSTAVKMKKLQPHPGNKHNVKGTKQVTNSTYSKTPSR